MADNSQILQTMLAEGATASLRVLTEIMEGEDAARLYRELRRLVVSMEKKHSYPPICRACQKERSRNRSPHMRVSEVIG